MDRLLDRKETSKILNVSMDTVDSLAKNGDLKKLKIGKRTLFHQDDVQQFMERLVRKGAVSLA